MTRTPPFLRALPTLATLVAVLSACGEPTQPVRLPPASLKASLTGAIEASVQGTPRMGRYPALIDNYGFDIMTDVRDGWYQYIYLWGEGGRPRVGTYRLTSWREGEPGMRMHALFGRDIPGGAITFGAIDGELRITRSTPEGVVGEFQFEAVEGILLLDRFAPEPDATRLFVRGTFSVECPAGQEVCK